MLNAEYQMVWVFRTFKLTNVGFYYSKQAKNTRPRLVQSPNSFVLITNVTQFVYYSYRALNHRGYIHLDLKDPHKNSRLGKLNSKLVCLDVDKKKFGKTLLWFFENILKKNLQDGRLTLYNRTEHGYHLFFLEKNPGKNRLWKRLTAIGTTIDYLPSGFVTILGPGYQLVGHKYKPDFKSFPFIPWAFKIANKTNMGFNYSGVNPPHNTIMKLKNVTSKGLIKHFRLSQKISAKKKNIKSLKKTFNKTKNFSLAVHSFLQCGYLWAGLLYRNNQPPDLFKLLNEWGFNLLNKNSQPFFMGPTRNYNFVLVEKERICLPKTYKTKKEISDELNIQAGVSHPYAKDLRPAEDCSDDESSDDESDEVRSSKPKTNKSSVTNTPIKQTKFPSLAEIQMKVASYKKSLNK